MPLNKESRYSEIKAWFEPRIEDLPDYLDGHHKIYHRLKENVQDYIRLTDNIIENLGHNGAAKNAQARAYKWNLYIAYLDLIYAGHYTEND